MRMLVIAATEVETAPFVATLGAASTRGQRLSSHHRAGHQVDVLITGVGMVAMAAWCSRALLQTRYDLALNLGICGAFDRTLQPGQVVHVVSDRIAELGAEDGDRFLTIQELHLVGADEFPFTGGELVNVSPPANSALSGLRAVKGITVNTVHGLDRSIADVTRRFAPQVETMEGAAFMYSCLIHGLAFAQVRAVSNIVEPRNREAWKLDEAISALGRAALSILERS